MDFSEFMTDKYGDKGSMVKKYRPNSLLPPDSDDVSVEQKDELVTKAPPEPPSKKSAPNLGLLEKLDLSKLTIEHIYALADYLAKSLSLSSEARLISDQFNAFEKEKLAFEVLVGQNPDKKDLHKQYHHDVFADTIQRACDAYRSLFNLIKTASPSRREISKQAKQICETVRKTELVPLTKYNSLLVEIANRKNPFVLTAETDLKILQSMEPGLKKPL